METVALRKQGYLSKMKAETFYNRYKTLGIRSVTMDYIKAFLIQFHDLDIKQWAIGKTKVFLRSDAVCSTLRQELTWLGNISGRTSSREI